MGICKTSFAIASDAEKWRGLHQLYRPGVLSGPQMPIVCRTKRGENTARDGIGDKFASIIARKSLNCNLHLLFVIHWVRAVFLFPAFAFIIRLKPSNGDDVLDDGLIA